MEYEVTIGIPLYNAERFIGRTLETALTQTFGSIEILVVDDCGTDASVATVRQMQSTHPRGSCIRIVSQPRNMGVGPARNRIIDEARGRYLYFMDSDDTIVPGAIALLYDNMKKHDAEVVFGSYEKIEDYGTERRSEVCGYPRMELFGDDIPAGFAFRKYGGIQASAWNYLVAVDILRRNGLRFIESKYWEDMVFTYTLMTYVTRAVLLPDVTYHYICRLNSLSNYQKRERISCTEVLDNVRTIDRLKEQTPRLRDKPYLGNWCYNVVMTDFYIVCNVLKNRNVIHPRITSAALRSFMRHPLTFGRILRLRKAMTANLFLYSLGKLPAPLFVWIVGLIGRRKGLV